MRKIIGYLVFFLTTFSLISCCYNIVATSQLTLTPTEAITSEEFKSGEREGNVIIAALEKNYKEKGHYPNSLCELMPAYLDALPTTITGQEFEYKLLETNEFNLGNPYILSFALKTKINTGCSYHPKYDEWECGPNLVK